MSLEWRRWPLEHTGLGRDSARFQARSAFTGVGFTTAEAEDLVGHPVRRRIVMWLMLVGNVGIVSAMAAVLLSALDLQTQRGAGASLVLLIGGIAVLWALGSSRVVDTQLCKVIRWAIGRFTRMDNWDYARLLHLRGDYGISRFRVQEGNWIAGKNLRGAGLGSEGLLVLGVECPGGNFVGAPPADIEVRAGDEIVVYGDATGASLLSEREAGEVGDKAHAEAAAEFSDRMKGERQRAGR